MQNIICVQFQCSTIIKRTLKHLRPDCKNITEREDFRRELKKQKKYRTNKEEEAEREGIFRGGPCGGLVLPLFG